MSRLFRLISLLALATQFITGAIAQKCSRATPCEVGCCSKWGFCGWGDAFCGAGCLNSCNAKKQCDADRPCEIGCCSKFGFCGLGKSFCGDDCAYQCDQKAQCDPGGWGSEYVNHTKCPLNVCCSKFGFCGMTEEFCGDKTAKHPTCDVGSHPIKRLVGYYEGWSSDRYCGQMYPEIIPGGVYTHINFASGSIDPATFMASPGGPRDESLWHRVQAVRRTTPGVQVWLAIGGWTFNDDNQATRTTFSDTAASEANREQFTRSLIALMKTYQFDGVDIDWSVSTYPLLVPPVVMTNMDL